ncbi:MAG: hypothetical protein HEP71_33300 [Roseivirga sp.]|nr:hypothetical protein [Roseivirga sp.]
MFDGPDYPKSLEEDLFETWLEKGRESKIGFEYMLIVWDDVAQNYRPVYAESRQHIRELKISAWGDSVEQESLIAVYDLFSESRIGGYSV